MGPKLENEVSSPAWSTAPTVIIFGSWNDDGTNSSNLTSLSLFPAATTNRIPGACLSAARSPAVPTSKIWRASFLRSSVEDLAGELLALLGRASGAVGLERFLDALERAAPAHVHDPDAVALEVLDSLLVGGSVLAGLLEGRRLRDEVEVEGDPADDEPGERVAGERDPGHMGAVRPVVHEVEALEGGSHLVRL